MYLKICLHCLTFKMVLVIQGGHGFSVDKGFHVDSFITRLCDLFLTTDLSQKNDLAGNS